MTDISRRIALKLTGQAFLALAACSPLVTIAKGLEDQPVSWERFLELCHQLSAAQVEPDWDQLAYCREIQRLLFQLNLDDNQVQTIIQRYQNYSPRFPEIRSIHHEQQFMVSMLEFEVGEEIGLHDHPDMTGVTLCTQGKLQVDHYDVLTKRSSADNLLLQQRQKLVMGAGDSAILTADHGNIHTLKADQFTRLIDVFTPPYNRDRSRRSKYYQRDSTPYQGQVGVFEGEVI